MTQLDKFTKLSQRFSSAKNATRLWNWADHQKSPEPFWAALRAVCPQYFYGVSATRFYFTY